MDSVTHVLLGATVGLATTYPKMGRHALIWGALFNSLPDLDVIFRHFSTHPLAELIYHRWITHSVLFAPIMAPIFAVLLYYIYKRRFDYMSWLYLIFFALFTHPILDTFTVYGTQLLSPFSDQRFSISALPIVDPFYTLWLVAGLILLYFTKKSPQTARFFGVCAIAFSSIYIVFGYAQNQIAQTIAKQDYLQHCKTPSSCQLADIQTFTTLFQPYWRRVVAIDANNTHYVGFVSSHHPTPIEWAAYHSPADLNTAFLDDPVIKTFIWFTQDNYTIQYDEPTRVVSLVDDRYGYADDTLLGFWALQFTIDEQGHRTSDISRINYRENVQLTWPILKSFFGKTWPKTMPE